MFPHSTTGNGRSFWQRKKFWFFLERIQNFRHQKIFFTNGSIPRQSARHRISHLRGISEKKIVPVTFARPNTMAELAYFKTDWPQNKPFPNWNYQSQPLLGLTSVNTFNEFGTWNKLACSKTFRVDILEIFCSNFRAKQKKVTLSHDKNINTLRLALRS